MVKRAHPMIEEGPSAGRQKYIQDFDALRWLSERGFAPYRHSLPFNLMADEQASGTFALRRLLVPSCGVALLAVPASETFSVMLILEGSLTVANGPAARETYPAGSLFLQRLDRRTEIEFDQSTALIQVSSNTKRWAMGVSQDQTRGPRIVPSERVANPFIAYVAAALNNPLAPGEVAFGAHQRAVEAMVAAMILEGDPFLDSAERSHSHQALLDRARTIIRARLGDPSTTLDSIARELSVSVAHLVRIFRSTGTSPMRYLRQIRASEATWLLTEASDLPLDEAREMAARQSGFTSVRAMLDTIRRESETR